MPSFKIGFGWNTDIDIDCSVVTIDKFGDPIETIYYGNLTSLNGSIIHQGLKQNS